MAEGETQVSLPSKQRWTNLLVDSNASLTREVLTTGSIPGSTKKYSNSLSGVVKTSGHVPMILAIKASLLFLRNSSEMPLTISLQSSAP